MSDAARIEFGQPYEFELPEEIMPPKVLGNPYHIPRESPFQVFIVERTLRAIQEHTQQSKNRECAGVIVGHPFRAPGGETVFVIVTEAVPLAAIQASHVHVKITPEASAQARHFVEQHFPGQRLVGWYHSHPDLGVFLSADDSVITQSIYNAQWHLALVLDPVRNELGLFRGPQQEQVGYLLIRDAPKTVQAVATYNLAVELWEQGQRQEAISRFVGLERLVSSEDASGELGLWQERGGYRDVAAYLEMAGYCHKDAPRQVALPAGVQPNSRPNDIAADLARLYASGKDSVKREEWHQAKTFFQQVASIDPAYAEVQDWLSAAEQQLRAPQSSWGPFEPLRELLFGRDRPYQATNAVETGQPGARSGQDAAELPPLRPSLPSGPAGSAESTPPEGALQDTQPIPSSPGEQAAGDAPDSAALAAHDREVA